MLDTIQEEIEAAFGGILDTILGINFWFAAVIFALAVSFIWCFAPKDER